MYRVIIDIISIMGLVPWLFLGLALIIRAIKISRLKKKIKKMPKFDYALEAQRVVDFHAYQKGYDGREFQFDSNKNLYNENGDIVAVFIPHEEA